MRQPFPPRGGSFPATPGYRRGHHVRFPVTPPPLERCPATPVDGELADPVWKEGAEAARDSRTARATWLGSGRNRKDGPDARVDRRSAPPACPTLPRQACRETRVCPAVCQSGPLPPMSVGRRRRGKSEARCQPRLQATTARGAGVVSACIVPASMMRWRGA